MPALFTRIVGRPKRDRTSATAWSMEGRSLTSTTSPMAAEPVVPILSAAASAPSPLTSKMATAAPSAASRSLIANPIPDAPPVTMATRCSLT